MILYHFTSSWLREPILRDGLKRAKPSGVDHVFRTPLLPCVWLTTDPEMPDDHCRFNDLRITVDIPSDDQRLQHWPTYWREQAEDDFKNVLVDNVIPSDPPTERFYCYFGTIHPSALRLTIEGPAQLARRHFEAGGRGVIAAPQALPFFAINRCTAPSSSLLSCRRSDILSIKAVSTSLMSWAVSRHFASLSLW